MQTAAAAAAAALLLLLLPWVLLPAHAAAAGNGSCARSCGGLTVRYPFGFSPGCEIQLVCDDQAANGAAWLGARELGLLVSNVTARALVLTLPPDCSRRLDASVEALFSGNYAPGPQNTLLVSSCNRAARPGNCSVSPATYLNSSSHCFHGANAENFSCVSPPLPPRGNRFFNETKIRALGSECTGLVSAAASYWDAPAPAVLLGLMELEWWMGGPCRCAPNANCTPITTPAAGQGFRCECREGFEGDGFAAGTGCRRGQCAALYSINCCLISSPVSCVVASSVELVSQIMRASDVVRMVDSAQCCIQLAHGTRMAWTVGSDI